MSNLRIVLDTGVVVSAALVPQSVPRQAFDRAWTSGVVLASSATIGELDEVLRREKFNKYVPESLRLEFLAAVIRDGKLIDITETIDECRDPKDNKFLELAVCGSATHLVTGDLDLLALHPFRGIAIVTPQRFLEGMNEASSDALQP